MNKIKKAILVLLTVCLTASLSTIAGATSYSFSSNDGSTGIKNDLNDLDHYKLYVWGINPTGVLNTIKSKNETIIVQVPGVAAQLVRNKNTRMEEERVKNNSEVEKEIFEDHTL